MQQEPYTKICAEHHLLCSAVIDRPSRVVNVAWSISWIADVAQKRPLQCPFSVLVCQIVHCRRLVA